MFHRRRNAAVNVETDRIADFLKGDRELIFDRFYGDIEHFGHFPVFQPVLFGQFEDHPAFGRELVDRLLDKSQHICRNEQLLGVEINAGEFRLEVIDGVGGIPPLFIQVVISDIAGGDVEIDSQVLYFLQLLPPLPDLDENIGNDLFGGLF